MSANLDVTVLQLGHDQFELEVSTTVPAQHFLTTLSNKLEANGRTRVVTMGLVALPQASVTHPVVRSGAFVKTAAENNIKVVVQNAQGAALESVTKAYSGAENIS